MVNSTITPDATVGRAEAAVASGLADETVVMDAEQLRYHGLNATGSHIWNLLSRPRTVRDLTERVATEYEVETEQCENEVQAFLEDLLRRNVICVVEAAEE